MDQLSQNVFESTNDKSKMDDKNIENEAGNLAEVSETCTEEVTCQFFIKGRCRFGEKCRNSHTNISETTLSAPAKSTKTGKVKTSEPKGKKPPMKTALDVISRIRWDAMLPKECFSVGYLDRFLGIIEKPFSAFSWDDLASVSYDVLAIPKHRIQYFKFKDLVVWDKSTRTDNVFGSAGSGMTILDVIEKYDSLLQTEEHYVPTNKIEPKDLEEELNFMETDEQTNECSSHRDSAEKLRPSHFIAVRISSEDVKSSVKQIQNLLLKNNPEFAEFCSPLPTLHLTLCLLFLNSPEEIQSALLALQEFKSELQRILPPSLILGFEGLKDFHSHVLYLAPSSITELSKFADTLIPYFCSKGLKVIRSTDTTNFHVTIAKIPKHALKRNPSLLFPQEIYENDHKHFGAQQVDSLSFCYAGSSRRTDGFYTTLMELSLY
ncbi:leukocyte receptor cluster member 9 isoform X2 [Bombina bombina]|nr:leukocyte receptor cluster member 9 isoform X2 [Bombina bombina]